MDLEALEAPVVFINYRREDTRPTANRLQSELQIRLCQDATVFLDERGLLSGRFPRQIRTLVRRSSVFLSLVGSDWLRVACPKSHQRRIDDENDWVRREIEWALQSLPHSAMLQIAVDGAAFVGASAQLPKSMRHFAEIQGQQLDNGPRWESDVDRIEGIVKALLKHAYA